MLKDRQSIIRFSLFVIVDAAHILGFLQAGDIRASDREGTPSGGQLNVVKSDPAIFFNF